VNEPVGLTDSTGRAVDMGGIDKSSVVKATQTDYGRSRNPKMAQNVDLAAGITGLALAGTLAAASGGFALPLLGSTPLATFFLTSTTGLPIDAQGVAKFANEGSIAIQPRPVGATIEFIQNPRAPVQVATETVNVLVDAVVPKQPDTDRAIVVEPLKRFDQTALVGFSSQKVTPPATFDDELAD
jgi:hypothetical protein